MTTAAAPAHDARYSVGVLMVFAAGTCLSLSGLILRNLEAADGWQVSFYRSVAFVATLLAWLAIRYRSRIAVPFRRVGRGGLIIAACLAVGSACYPFALMLTTVADAMFIISTTPLFAALLGRLVLGERVSPSTWSAIFAALVGIALMFAQGFEAGGLLGRVVALGPMITMAAMVVTMRHYRNIDMIPAVCLGGVVLGVFSAVMAHTVVVSTHDLLLCLLLGTVQFGLAFLLLTRGSPHVPAAQVALLLLAEPVLAPLWVWIFVGEVPSRLTMIGGVIVLAALVWQALAAMRRERMPPPAPPV